jgi:hypothetical protein
MAEPPVVDGAVQMTEADLLSAVAATCVGALGRSSGSTALDGVDVGPTPRTFMAATTKVYVVPLVSPLTVHVVAPVVVQVFPPGVAVTVYLVTGEPPLFGAVHTTLADPLPAVATTLDGGPGTVEGVSALGAVVAGPAPLGFCAATVTVYVVPFTKPVMVADVEIGATVVVPLDEPLVALTT